MFLRRFSVFAYTDHYQCLTYRWRGKVAIALPSLKEAFEVLELFYRNSGFSHVP